MATIHQLPPEIVAKIAAGEVIERPAFAVKELIENALDAEATEVQIFIEDAGLKKIQINDNGKGMSKEDLEICWKPHTTSKLTENNNLIGIRSFGFRGEALASLAAVSTLTIKSRREHDTTGHQVEIENGKMLKSIPAGMPHGTTVIAEHLFASIPARKKFLKSTQTEFRHIVEVISHFAIAYPTVIFLLKHNNRTVLDFSHNRNQTQRIEHIVGKETFSFFLPFKNNDSHISLSGYIAKPQMHSSTQSRQILFVNNRKVTDRLISLAVKEAFGTMLESNTYPLFILFLQLPYEMVDINVHPRKEQLAFFNNQSLFQIIKETALETLQKNNLTFQNLSWKRAGFGTTQSFAGKLLKQTVLDKEDFQIKSDTPLIQINHLYILSQTKEGIVLTDQHAAHERILFEKLLKEFINRKRKRQTFQLTNPVILQFTTTENILFNQRKKMFKKLGFVIADSQKKLPIITHVPYLFQDRDPQEFIKQLLETIEEDVPLKEVDKISEEMIAFLACRASVKAGDELNESEMKKILENLAQTPHNATCPHGRPTQILLSIRKVNALFKR